jgi:hypothetical protein
MGADLLYRIVIHSIYICGRLKEVFLTLILLKPTKRYRLFLIDIATQKHQLQSQNNVRN